MRATAGRLSGSDISCQETVLQKPTDGAPRPDDAGQTDRDQAPADRPLQPPERAGLARRPRPGCGPRAVRRRATTVRAVAASVHLRRARPPDRRRGDRGGRVAPRVPAHDPAGRRRRHRRRRGCTAARGRGQRRRSSADSIDAGEADGFEAPAAAAYARRTPASRRSSLPASPERPRRRAVGRRRHGRAAGYAVPPPPPPSPRPLLDDGTLLTGYAPDTAVDDGSDLVRTLQGASRATRWHRRQAVRRLDDDPVVGEQAQVKDDLHVGQVLRIPPVSGLVYTVKDTDTLDRRRASHEVTAAKVVELNGLEDPTLVVGQVLVLPGAKGAPMPTPKPTPKPQRTSAAATSASGGGGGGGGARRRRPAELLRRQLPLAGRRWRQLRQPVLPLRPLWRSTSRPTTASHGRRGGGRPR